MAVETLQPGIEATRTLIAKQDNQAVNGVEHHTDFPQYTVIQIDHRTTPEQIPSKLSPIAKKLALKGEPDGLIFLPIGESENGYMIPVKVRIGEDHQEVEPLRDGSKWHVYPEVYSVPQAVYSVDQNTYSLVPTPHRIIVNSETLDHLFLREDKIDRIVPLAIPPIVEALAKEVANSGWVYIPFDRKQPEYGIQVLVREGRDIYEQCDQLFQGSPIFINPELYPKPVLVPNPEDPGKPILVFDRPANPNNPNSYFKVLINIENGNHYIVDESQIAMMRENKPQAPNRNGNQSRNDYGGVHEFIAFNAPNNGHETRNGQEIRVDQIKGQIKGRFVSTYLAQMTDDSIETGYEAIKVKRAWEIWKEEISATAEDEVKEIIGQTTLKDCAEEVTGRHTNWRNTANQSPEDESDWSKSKWDVSEEDNKLGRAEKAFKEAAEL